MKKLLFLMLAGVLSGCATRQPEPEYISPDPAHDRIGEAMKNLNDAFKYESPDPAHD